MSLYCREVSFQCWIYWDETPRIGFVCQSDCFTSWAAAKWGFKNFFAGRWRGDLYEIYASSLVSVLGSHKFYLKVMRYPAFRHFNCDIGLIVPFIDMNTRDWLFHTQTRMFVSIRRSFVSENAGKGICPYFGF